MARLINHYKILEIKFGTSQEEIKKAYRRLSKKHHPDVGGDEEIFIRITNSYEVLSDEIRRKEYDLLFKQEIENIRRRREEEERIENIRKAAEETRRQEEARKKEQEEQQRQKQEKDRMQKEQQKKNDREFNANNSNQQQKSNEPASISQTSTANHPFPYQENRAKGVMIGISIALNIVFLIGFIGMLIVFNSSKNVQADYENLSSKYNTLLAQHSEVKVLLKDGQNLVNNGASLLETTRNEKSQLEAENMDLIKENQTFQEENTQLLVEVEELRAEKDALQNQLSAQALVNDSVVLTQTNGNLTDAFTLGSTKEEVKAAMGVPTSISPYVNRWSYEFSDINFDDDDRVVGWSDTSNNLKVR